MIPILAISINAIIIPPILTLPISINAIIICPPPHSHRPLSQMILDSSKLTVNTGVSLYGLLPYPRTVSSASVWLTLLTPVCTKLIFSLSGSFWSSNPREDAIS